MRAEGLPHAVSTSGRAHLVLVPGEEREQRVAAELQDITVVPVDLFQQGGENRRDGIDHLLRADFAVPSKLLGQRSESGDVGEQQASLLGPPALLRERRLKNARQVLRNCLDLVHAPTASPSHSRTPRTTHSIVRSHHCRRGRGPIASPETTAGEPSSRPFEAVMTKRSLRLVVFAAALVVPLGTTVSVAGAASSGVTVTATIPSTLSLQGTVHDFEHTANVCSTGPINPDFETYAGNGASPGLIAPTLDSGGLPVFASNGTPTQLTGAGSFGQWYRDVPNVNLSFASPLTVNRDVDAASPSGYRYTYSNLSFSPADGQGWDTAARCGGTHPQEDQGVDGGQHNFSFTDHIQSTFGYLPGETVDVGGDDDVWVFINGHLAIDLGGLHPFADSGVYQLAAHEAELGLVKGHTYSFDVFFAERHTQASTLTLNTTMGLEPTFGISNLSRGATAPQPLGPGATDLAAGDIPSGALPAAAVDAFVAAPLRSVPLRSVPLR